VQYLRFSTSTLALVVCELLAISCIRYRFTGGKLANAIGQVVIGSAFAIGAWFGRIGVS